MFWFTPAGQRGPLRASRPRWPAPAGAWCCRARDGPEPGVPGDGRGSGRPPRHGQGSAARREAPWRRPPRRAGTEALGQRLDTARAGITRLRPKSFRCQLTRALGLQRRITPKRARRTSMTSTDDDLSHSCGGDMSTPQKCLPTRHYLQTTSDNRRSVRSWRLQSSQASKRRTGNLVPRCSRPSVQRLHLATVAVDVDRAARHRRAGVQRVCGAALLVSRPGDLLRCATSRRRLSRSPLPSASSHFGPRSRSRGRCR